MKKYMNKKGEGFVDSGVKILIAVVIGALLLSGLYVMYNSTIMPSVKSKVESMFDYSGTSTGAYTNNSKIHFTIDGFGEFTANEGDTFEDWLNATQTSSGTNGIVWQLSETTVFGDDSYGLILVETETLDWMTWDTVIQDGDNYWFREA